MEKSCSDRPICHQEGPITTLRPVELYGYCKRDQILILGLALPYLYTEKGAWSLVTGSVNDGVSMERHKIL